VGRRLPPDAGAGGEVWAAGWSAGPSGRLRPLAARLDGGAWRVTPTPDPGAGDALLSAVVALDDGTAWAVGWSLPAPDDDRALILRWDGDRWREVPAPELDGRAQLIDVAASGPDDVWVAGRVTDGSGTFGSLLLHGDGRTWRRVSTPDIGADDDTLAGVAVVEGAPWGVGTSVDAEGKYTSLVLSGC
jgi:hypothetical protein